MPPFLQQTTDVPSQRDDCGGILEIGGGRHATHHCPAEKFADHGMISAVIVDKGWTIDSWIMSCRVLQRGVEATIMQETMARAMTAGKCEVSGTYVPTQRNSLVQDFYPRFGFEECGRGAAGIAYRIVIANAVLAPSAMTIYGPA